MKNILFSLFAMSGSFSPAISAGGFSQSMLDQLASANRRAGASGGIVMAFDSTGRILGTSSFGSPNPEKGTTWSLDTFNRVGSVSKLMTAEAAKQLIAEGKLSLETKVFDFLRYPAPLDPRLGQITVQMLLEHRGGWSSKVGTDPHFDQFKVAGNGSLPITPSQAVRYGYDHYPLAHAPGTVYDYSNFGYSVLDIVIAKAAGMSYAEYTGKMLASMKVSGLQPGKTLVPAPGEATYSEAGPERTWNSVIERGKKCTTPYGCYALETMEGFGGWIATANGLKSFILATAGKPKFNPMGWMTGTGRTSGKMVYFHGGSVEGCAAFVTYRPSDGVGVVGVFNCGPGSSGGQTFDSVSINFLGSNL